MRRLRGHQGLRVGDRAFDRLLGEAVDFVVQRLGALAGDVRGLHIGFDGILGKAQELVVALHGLLEVRLERLGAGLECGLDGFGRAVELFAGRFCFRHNGYSS